MVQEIEYIIVIHPAEEGGFWSEVPVAGRRFIASADDGDEHEGID